MRGSFALFILLANFACYDSSVSPICDNCDAHANPDCPLSILIDHEKFQTFSYPIVIKNASVSGNCMEIVFEFTGCGNGVELKLYDSGSVSISDTTRRELKLILGDASMGCPSATYEKTRGFDIIKTQTPGGNLIAFKLVGWPDLLYYHY